MSSSNELNESIRLYTEQLSQVEHALATTENSSERKDLENLKDDLNELLHLTRETLEQEHGQGTSASSDGGMKDEFAAFMAEINDLDCDDQHQSDRNPSPNDASEALADLIGSKCSAPHLHRWGSKAFHNALICSLDASDNHDIKMKVLFINPTHQEMIPCPFFLEGECKFDDDKCRYSHGEMVAFSDLKDYRQPRFELLEKKGWRVLAKQKNRLWAKGAVKEADFDKKMCKIIIDEGKQMLELPFEDILPLEDEGDDNLLSNSDDSSSEDDGTLDDDAAFRQAGIIQRSLLNPAPSQRLGEWEKYTKGIGSKIMIKMGYVVGAGLGSKGEGIVVPVSAQVLPQGRSLDYCMELRERANGNSDLFSVEKKLQRLKKTQEMKNARQHGKNAKRKVDVFNFLNNEILGNTTSDFSGSSDKKQTALPEKLDLPSCSSKNLNIASLKLSQHTRRLTGDIERLQNSLARHQPGSQVYSSLKKQIADKRSEIAQMQVTEKSINQEQQLRSDKRKMTIF
ncbi:zinc finger CCCH-type with G patch domain-containing protein [Wyeomyia smithii]|uniref:zinc finger CCCH-type with G patch domain-containing protein n=1 Tax=Wyeomyia smithii TaxID=174621 RepID=UPI002467D61F|nr:zinc finger CCCH-type with G patch domain-containing protein [Wyeomyia smithii]